MAQFLNQEADPKVKDSAKVADTLPQEPARIDYDNATDLGLNALERATIAAEAMTPTVSSGTSFMAGMGNSIMAAALRKAGAPSFDADYNFNAQQTLYKDERAKMYSPTQEEITYLHGAVSQDDYEYRMEDMLKQRRRNEDMMSNPITGIAGSILGDAPFMVMPMAAAGITGRAGLAVRTAIRAADVGTAAYASDQLGQSNAVLAMVAGAAGVDELFDVSRTLKAVRAAKAATATDAVDTLDNAATTPLKPADAALDTVTDADAPTFRGAADTVVPKTTKVDATINSVQELHARKLAQPITIRKGDIAGVTLKGADITEHLLASGKLNPAAKAMLNQIRDLVGDVDVHVRADPSIRSHFKIPEGSAVPTDGYVMLRAPAGLTGKTVSTVGELLSGMDDNLSNVAVHELVHAATAVALRKPANTAIRAELDALAVRIQPVLKELDSKYLNY